MRVDVGDPGRIGWAAVENTGDSLDGVTIFQSTSAGSTSILASHLGSVASIQTNNSFPILMTRGGFVHQ